MHVVQKIADSRQLYTQHLCVAFSASACHHSYHQVRGLLDHLSVCVRIVNLFLFRTVILLVFPVPALFSSACFWFFWFLVMSIVLCNGCALICFPCLKSGVSGTLLVVFKYLPTTVACLVVITAIEKECVPCMNKFACKWTGVRATLVSLVIFPRQLCCKWNTRFFVVVTSLSDCLVSFVTQPYIKSSWQSLLSDILVFKCLRFGQVYSCERLHVLWKLSASSECYKWNMLMESLLDLVRSNTHRCNPAFTTVQTA